MNEISDIANEMGPRPVQGGGHGRNNHSQIKALSLPAKRAFRPEEIRRIRQANHVSQAVFAAILGIGKTTVQQWERGEKRPSGPAQRLLDLIDRKRLAALG
ncbi:MAG: helix-turn-helix domain-containing protein [Syntrophales bacterium]|nr:helix-turn-helix domain-containing protein [Syntrophales bacterium]MDD5641280.1 helix-turn-helix domain-containing protein [Syntrophales bacterium]